MQEVSTLLEKAGEVLKGEGKVPPTQVNVSNEELLVALESLKNISGEFYFWEPTQTSGLLRPVRNILLKFFHRFAKAILGKAVQKQQKFNDAAYLLLKQLVEK